MNIAPTTLNEILAANAYPLPWITRSAEESEIAITQLIRGAAFQVFGQTNLSPQESYDLLHDKFQRLHLTSFEKLIEQGDEEQMTNEPHLQANITDQIKLIESIIHYFIENSTPQKEILETADSKGKTALMYAAEKGHRNVVSLLINSMMDRLADKITSEKIAFDYVIDAHQKFKGPNSEAVFVSELLDKKDFKGKTALIYAAENGRQDVVSLLINSGARINEKDYTHNTALTYAVKKGHRDVVSLLINSRLHITVDDVITVVSDKTVSMEILSLVKNAALLCAVQRGQLYAIAPLLQSGADVNAKNIEKVTALMYACYQEQRYLLSLLIANGADVNARDIKGNTVLMYAVSAKNKDHISLLLRNGAKINAHDIRGHTALIHATQADSEEIVELLISNNADVNQRDATQGTPLMHACLRQGDNTVAIMKLLIQAGADIYAEDIYHETALTLAQHMKHKYFSKYKDIAALLAPPLQAPVS
jgi:ankyrin repeat protein